MDIKNHAWVHTQRIRQICAFLSAGGGSLQEMHAHVNQGLEDVGLEPIGLRTLQACIEKLREGDFDHSKKELPVKTRRKLFRVVYAQRVYTWAANTEYPAFGDLDEDERYTLPFLAGILKRFEAIPAVQKILYQLPELFNISESEMESQSAIFQTGPVLFDPGDPDFESKVIRCVIKILSHIHRGEVIEFNYTRVAVYDSKIENLTLQQVSPLQIRFYAHHYYLIAADLEGKKILNFRIDQIHRLNVAAMESEAGEVVTFNRPDYEKRLGVSKKFKDALGVWLHGEKDPLHEIHLAFYGWAASYVKRLQLHSSQKLVREDKSAQTLVISVKLRLAVPTTHPGDVLDRNPELAFLLGRFRSDGEVIWVKPVG